MKKIISLLLALLLVAALGAPAFAESTTPKPEVTKHPTGETVNEGGQATFIARANNATEIIWRIVSNDTTNTVQAADAPAYFGCTVAGLGTDTLVIGNIPAAMDGWRVEAMFRGPGGVSFSNGALIRVNGVTVKAPTISAQPQPLSLASGETGTLTVSAAGVEGELSFQWYSNTANSNQGGTAIEGATQASFSPEEQTGTTYYYVAVTSVLNGRSSDAVLSNAVAVTFAAPAEQDPAPVVTPAPGTPAPLVPVVDTPEDEPSAEPTEAPERDPERSTAAAQSRTENALNMLAIVGGVLAVAALVGGVTALVVRRRSGDDDEDDEDE